MPWTLIAPGEAVQSHSWDYVVNVHVNVHTCSRGRSKYADVWLLIPLYIEQHAMEYYNSHSIYYMYVLPVLLFVLM